MTLDEALAVCDRAKPNQYSRSEKIRWLSDADGLVQREILDTLLAVQRAVTVPQKEE